MQILCVGAYRGYWDWDDAVRFGLFPFAISHVRLLSPSSRMIARVFCTTLDEKGEGEGYSDERKRTGKEDADKM